MGSSTASCRSLSSSSASAIFHRSIILIIIMPSSSWMTVIAIRLLWLTGAMMLLLSHQSNTATTTTSTRLAFVSAQEEEIGGGAVRSNCTADETLFEIRADPSSYDYVDGYDWFVVDVSDRDDPRAVLNCGGLARVGVQCDLASRPDLYIEQSCLPRNACYRLVTYSRYRYGDSLGYGAGEIMASLDGESFHLSFPVSTMSHGFGTNCEEYIAGGVSVIEVFSPALDGLFDIVPVQYELLMPATVVADESPVLYQQHNNSLFQYAWFEIPAGSCVTIAPLDVAGGRGCRITLDGVVYKDHNNCSDSPTLVGTNCDASLVCIPEQQSLVEVQTLVGDIYRYFDYAGVEYRDYESPSWDVDSKGNVFDYRSSYRIGYEYQPSTDYVDFVCVPRKACSQLYFYDTVVSVDYSARVDGTDRRQSSECITVYGSPCRDAMTRLVDVDCPLPLGEAQVRQLMTAGTVLGGLVIGFVIGWLIHLSLVRFLAKQRGSSSSNNTPAEGPVAEGPVAEGQTRGGAVEMVQQEQQQEQQA